MIRFRLIGVVFVAVAPTAAVADSWGPFCSYRRADSVGRYYVVVKKGEGAPKDPGRGTPITFDIAERKAGTTPVRDTRDEEDVGRVIPSPDVRVRVGDIVHGRGKLERAPGFLFVSATGLGFVGLDVRGYNYDLPTRNDAMVIVTINGTVAHRKNLVDLFTAEEIASFGRSAGGIWWAGGGWIDERRQNVIVVSSRLKQPEKQGMRFVKIVEIKSGVVREGSTSEVVTALNERNLGALKFALELTAELQLKEALPHLPGLVADETLLLAHRLRAAVALGTFDDRRGAMLITKAALEKSDDQYYAVEHLPFVLGDKAAPVLCDVVRRYENRCKSAAWHAVSPAAAVPELIRLLDERTSAACQTFATECLGKKGPAAKSAVPSLIKLLQEESRPDGIMSTHEHAAIALGKIGPDAQDALPLLIKLAEVHAKDEWARIKTEKPDLRPDNFGGKKYSDDYFVDAICKIRQN
jgi:hypothetical protein